MKQLSYFIGGIKAVVPTGVCSLEQMLNGIKKPKPNIIKTLEAVQLYSKEKNETKRAAYKAQLPFFTPAVQVSYRNYDSIKQFTGILPLDFDKLPSKEYATEFKDFLFAEHPEIIAAWLSSSALGVRALVRIPVVVSVGEFKEYFEGFAMEHAHAYQGFDIITKNPIQPLYISHDPDLLYRKDALLWNERIVAQPPKPTPQPKFDPSLMQGSGVYERRVIATIKSSIDKITDNGHPQLRAAAYALGGYVGAGYITQTDAEQLIDRLIDGNAYLVNKSSTYKKTADTMINKGHFEPLYFSE